MKAFHFYKIMGLLAALSLSSCVKDDLYNTPHPDRGAVQVTTDWTAASADAVLPDSYILRLGTQEQTVNTETDALNTLFEPGTHTLLVYHQTAGITVSGTTATVNTREDGTLEPLPGYLFSASGVLEIVKDDTLQVNIKMQQHTRCLTLTLNLTPGDEQRISTTAATLTGIASAIDLTDGTFTTTGQTVSPVFILGTVEDTHTRASGTPVLSATLHLLGMITTQKQQLTLAHSLTNGTTQTLTTDLTELLKNFSTGGSMEPLTLDATLQLPPTEEDEDLEIGFSGSISNWTPGNGANGESGSAE